MDTTPKIVEPKAVGKTVEAADKPLNEKELNILKLLCMEPQKLSLQSLAESIQVEKDQLISIFARLANPLREQGCRITLNKKKAQITVEREGFFVRESKVFKIAEGGPQEDCVKPDGFSGVYYGSNGFRYGVLLRTFKDLRRERVPYIVLGGGLVYGPALYDKFPKGMSKAQKAEFESFTVERIARELALVLPRLQKPDGKFVKIYITTSPVFDGKIGHKIAQMLADLCDETGNRLREDIVYLGNKNIQLLPSIVQDINILPAVPIKKRLPAKYASTSVQTQKERLKKILQKKSKIDVVVFGGYGVNCARPKAGEESMPWVTLPMSHKLNEEELQQDSESEVGHRIIKIYPDYYTVKTYDLKSLVLNEREYVSALFPREGISQLQLRVIEALKVQPKTIGVLEDELAVSRNKIKQAIDVLQKFRVGIVLNPLSGYYDFMPEWMQWHVRYPSQDNMKEDRIVSIACLHATACSPEGVALTNYQFACETLPDFIIKKRANIIVVAGDKIQGLPKVHGYHVTGQIYEGLEVLAQEMVAAFVCGKKIMGTVFRHYFAELLNQQKGNTTPEDVLRLVDLALPQFVHCDGNHDLWTSKEGVKAGEYFSSQTFEFICGEIYSAVQSAGLNIGRVDLSRIVNAHIFKDFMSEPIRYRTPNGLTMKVVHPHTARTQTLSITSEGGLSKYPDAQIIIAGNWHIAFDQQQSSESLGLRHYAEIPTLQSGTFFEDSKQKRTDFGANYSCVSSQGGKVYAVESGFYGAKNYRMPVDERANNAYLENIVHELKLDKFSSDFGKLRKK